MSDPHPPENPPAQRPGDGAAGSRPGGSGGSRDLYTQLFDLMQRGGPPPKPAVEQPYSPAIPTPTAVAVPVVPVAESRPQPRVTEAYSAPASQAAYPPVSPPIAPALPAAAPMRRTARPVANATAPAPIAPANLSQSGISLMMLCDLLLKQLYLEGSRLGVDMARNARLPFNVVDEGLVFLKDEKCIEVHSGDLIGRASYRFNLTDLGRIRAREAFEQCRYVGPAPVSLEDYVQQCLKQSVTGTTCDPEALREAFQGLIIRPDLLDEVGPAVCSGRSIFVYGPPGNGKTMIAKGLGKFLNQFGGEIYIPYALHCEQGIVMLYDPTLHTATDNADVPWSEADPSMRAPGSYSRMMQEPATDLRWRRIRRPVIITGGELTLDMLDLRYNATANFYQAPLHIKANGGVFLIDDFGRQIVSPRDLLNRWILPLEEKIDYLTLVTGKKFTVPFEQLIIFSTNLDPRELVDEAFLRRIRHKIKIGTPDRTLFTQIFQLVCTQKNLAYSQDAVDYLFMTYYDRGKPAMSSDPRDLLEIVQSLCRFRSQEVVLSRELIAEASQRFFCQI